MRRPGGGSGAVSPPGSSGGNVLVHAHGVCERIGSHSRVVVEVLRVEIKQIKL